MAIDPWIALERGATLLAAGAAVVAVLLGRWTLSLYREERGAQRRSQAAAILSLADILRRRFEGFWRLGAAIEATWPEEGTLQQWEDELSQDIGYAERLVERASLVDPETAILAETLAHRCRLTQFVVGQARRSGMNFFSSGSGPDSFGQRKWEEYRLRIVTAMTETLCVLDEMEAYFKGQETRIGDVDRDQYRKSLDERVRMDAGRRAKEFLAELEKDHPYLVNGGGEESGEARSLESDA